MSNLPAVLEIASVVLFGRHVAFPTGGLWVLIGTLAVMVAFVTVRHATRDLREKSRRVLILGSGPMAATLIAEIESPHATRYSVAGVVDDHRPPDGSPERARWLGTSGQLVAIV